MVTSFGNCAPAMATATFRPARTLWAPQTLCRRLLPSVVTWQTDNFAALGCGAHSSTSPTTTAENGGATGVTDSTSKPAIVSCVASSSAEAETWVNSLSQLEVTFTLRDSMSWKLLQELQ